MFVELHTALRAGDGKGKEFGFKPLQVFIVESVFGGNYIRTTSYNIAIVSLGRACSRLLEKIGNW